MEKIRWKGNVLWWFAGEESGQGFVEYALVLLMIAMVVVASLGKIGPVLAADFDKAAAGLTK